MMKAVPFPAFFIITPYRWRSKMLKLSTNVDKKSLETRVFDCHFSPNWRQMAIKNTVPIDFY